MKALCERAEEDARMCLAAFYRLDAGAINGVRIGRAMSLVHLCLQEC